MLVSILLLFLCLFGFKLCCVLIGNASAFGYPSDLQAKIYCVAFRLSLASATGLFILLHFLAVACYFMFTQNKDRDSLVHVPPDFEAAALEQAAIRSARNSEAQASGNPILSSLSRTVSKQ